MGGSPHILMPPIVVDAKPGQASKAVDVLLRKFTHVPLGEWSALGLSKFGDELWWIHDGLKGLGNKNNVCAVSPWHVGLSCTQFSILLSFKGALQHWSAVAAVDPTMVEVELCGRRRLVFLCKVGSTARTSPSSTGLPF